jgi:protein-S-isoprenylcysteine O-methyltransferase Ste14
VTARPSLEESAIRGVAFLAALLFVVSLATGAATYAFAFSRTADAHPGGRHLGTLAATLIDVALFSLFALHHSLFARTGVKQWIGRAVAPRLERTFYVFVASLLFVAVCWWWVPVPGEAWRVGPPWSAALLAVQWSGVVVTIVASRVLDVWDLSGLRQALGGHIERPPVLIQSGLYRLVRHPIYFGWMLMVWPTPHMTGSRLIFAAISSLYLLLAVPGEERALRRMFGEAYAQYGRGVPYRIIPFLY